MLNIMGEMMLLVAKQNPLECLLAARSKQALGWPQHGRMQNIEI